MKQVAFGIPHVVLKQCSSVGEVKRPSFSVSQGEKLEVEEPRGWMTARQGRRSN